METERSERRLVVRYTGPVGGLLYAIASQWPDDLDQDDFDCTLTASIARHPAGKGIPSEADLEDCPHGYIRATCTTCRTF